MIRSSKHTTKFANKEKISKLEKMSSLYFDLVEKYLNMMIKGQLSFEKYLTSTKLPIVNEVTHSGWKQVAYKQAAQIIKSNITYQKKVVYNKFKKLYRKCKEKHIHPSFLNKKFNELNINILKRIKINLKNISIDIDDRLFDIQKDKTKEFDEYVRIFLPWFVKGKKRSDTVKIPIKYHKHSLKFIDWNRRNIIKYIPRTKEISFVYEKENTVKPNITYSKIGIDIGFKKLISDSNGNFYGKELESLYKRIANCVRGSKHYNRLLSYRTDLTNQIANEFVKENNFEFLMMENLKCVKYKSKLSRKFNNYLQYWSYRTLIDKLERLSEEKGFQIIKVIPAYTSQTCSQCGTIDKSNRNGEIYQCKVCNMLIDADTNAAVNILHRGDYVLSTQMTESL